MLPRRQSVSGKCPRTSMSRCSPVREGPLLQSATGSKGRSATVDDQAARVRARRSQSVQHQPYGVATKISPERPFARARRSGEGGVCAAAAPGRARRSIRSSGVGSSGPPRPDRAWCPHSANARDRARAAVPGRTVAGRNPTRGPPSVVSQQASRHPAPSKASLHTEASTEKSPPCSQCAIGCAASPGTRPHRTKLRHRCRRSCAGTWAMVLASIPVAARKTPPPAVAELNTPSVTTQWPCSLRSEPHQGNRRIQVWRVLIAVRSRGPP